MAVSIRHEGDLAVVIVDNPPVNALSQAVRQGLCDAVRTLDDDPSVSGVILMCAGRTFIAGADVSEFGKPPMEPHLRDVVAAIESAHKPWIAAIHGTALGGGFEIAMGCRFRVALEDAKIGLPEVTLGLIPGAGGTVRTPRLAGVDNAVELVTTGKPVGAVQALAMGLIDSVVADDLLSSAEAFARAAFAQELPLPVRARPVQATIHVDWAAIEHKVRKAARGEDAPLRALASIRNACTADFETALAFERDTFLALRASPQAVALRAVFFAERAALRPPEMVGIKARSIKKMAFIGGGKNGVGLVAALRDAGFPVTLIEPDQFDEAVRRGGLMPELSAARIAGVIGSTDNDALKNADLVIEAVADDLDVKRHIVSRLVEVCRPDAILATASRLDPLMIASNLAHQDRFIGLNFFNPAQVGKLLEIVPLPDTAPDVLAAAFALARTLDKVPVLAGRGEGFIGERLLKIMHRQAERLVSAGYSPAVIDEVMREFGFAMGPFEARERDDLDRPSLQRAAARDHDDGKNTAGTKPAMDRNAIVHAILFAMVDEGGRMLSEGVAKRATDIDLVAVHACGCPRRSGGPMHFASAFGLSIVLAERDRMHAAGLAAPPSEALRRAAAAGSWSAIGY